MASKKDSRILNNQDRGIASLISIILVVGIMLVVIVYGIPGGYQYIVCLTGGCQPDRISWTKGNMHSIHIGLEQYARSHKGKYPASLRPPDFEWKIHINRRLINPYDKSIGDVSLVEGNLTIDQAKGKSVATIAQFDKRIFKAPGMVRYYVSRHSATYSLSCFKK